MVLEFGDSYIRFHTQGETLLTNDTPPVPYEVPTPYAAADLFSIHYVQSADVMTLVHQNYAPMELARLGALNWTLTAINFGAPIASPSGVAVTASPGYLAKISTITEVAATSEQSAHSLIQTVSAHTLSEGDGIYISGLIKSGGTDLTGFYLVAGVPTDTDGNLVPNQLWVMDYSGNTVDAIGSGYTRKSTTSTTPTLSPQSRRMGSRRAFSLALPLWSTI